MVGFFMDGSSCHIFLKASRRIYIVFKSVSVECFHDMLPDVLIGAMPLTDLEKQLHAILNVLLVMLRHVMMGIMPPSGPRDTATCTN